MPSSQGYNYIIYDDFAAIGDGSSDHGNGFTNKDVQSLVIPSSIDGIIVKRILYRALSCLYELNSVVIPLSLEIIDGDLFLNCYKLKYIYFQEPSRVQTIGFFSFFGCNQLEQIILPSSVSSVGVKTFTSCLSLKYIIAPSPKCIFDENFNIDGNSNVIVYVPKCYNGLISNAIVSKNLECILPKTNNKRQYHLSTIILGLFFIT